MADMMDVFWILLILGTLQPVVKQRMLEAARQRLIAALEEKRGSRLILLVHRQEIMSWFGFPVVRYIDVEDSEEVIRAIHLTDEGIPIDLILHTPGGLALAASQIARAIRARKSKVTVFVPHYAMSGGTLVALAADEIVMCEHAVLGPVDPQLGELPAASILRVVEQKPVSEIEDRTLILADQASKAIAQVKELVREILDSHYPEETVKGVVERLTEGYWTHDYPITYEKAKSLGLRVSKEMPAEVLQLMQLYPQPIRKHPGVEYLPVPYHRHPGAGAAPPAA
jgi:ClpP class serine protease